MNNAELIARMLEQSGVRWVFGVPSGPVLPLIDALRESAVRFVLTASETSAGFMATAVGHLTGIPGVCVSTVGPGATNLATGVGAAWLDRAPLLAITCNVATPWLERRVQMRIDHHALFKPLTKSTLTLFPDSAGDLLSHALALAVAEPPGPVHIDLPEDTACAPAIAAVGRKAQGPQQAGLPPRALSAVATELQQARRPLLVVGLSFTRSDASAKLLGFIERHKLPFVTTLHAKGFLPESHRFYAGVIGRARRSDMKALCDTADLILAVGYDPVEMNYEEWVGRTRIVHLSTELAEPGEGLEFAVNEACDLPEAVAALAGLSVSANTWRLQEIEQHRARLESALRPPAGTLAAHETLDVLRRKLPPDGILSYDVGAHTHQIATQWRTDRPKTLLATNGWSSMGYGMPAAFAAKLVYPDRPVACVVGDGGFLMTAGELALARRLALAVPTVVLNDGWLGLMKVKQERRNYPLSGVRIGEPPASPPHYFGVPCRAATTADELSAALDWAFSLAGPSVVEVFIDVTPYSQTVFD